MGVYDTSLPHTVASEAIKHHAAEVEEQLTHRLVSKGQVLYAAIVAFFVNGLRRDDTPPRARILDRGGSRLGPEGDGSLPAGHRGPQWRHQRG